MIGSMFHALLGRRTNPIERAERSTWTVATAEGPVTAFEAYDIAERFAMQADIDAVCVSIASGEGLDTAGRCDRWVLRFRLPIRLGEARYEIRAAPATAAERGMTVDEALTPAGDVDQNQAARDAPDRVVPIPFRDSTAVVEALGSDAPPIRLESATADNGRHCWRITRADDEVTWLPLAA